MVISPKRVEANGFRYFRFTIKSIDVYDYDYLIL